MMPSKVLIENNVTLALEEDLRTGDITAELLPDNNQVKARIITREDLVLCGVEWATSCFKKVDSDLHIEALKQDGDFVNANETLFIITGNAKSILTAERCALNFVQTLSATATTTHKYASSVAHTQCKILDTRKTIPGLRLAQKYAVTMGGGKNHRVGLFDAILIKENHIAACGSITKAVKKAQSIAPDNMMIEVEVESHEELQEALNAGATRIMLDNFTPKEISEAVEINKKSALPAELEASGNITLETIKDYAEAGVDYISLGALTKHIRAIDLSLRIIEE